jgi:hypothetical protein
VKYVLDTNVVARLLDGDESILGRLGDVDPTDVGIPLGLHGAGTRTNARHARRGPAGWRHRRPASRGLAPHSRVSSTSGALVLPYGSATKFVSGDGLNVDTRIFNPRAEGCNSPKISGE